MKEIFKTLKKSSLAIVLIIVFLIIQALCNLKLPEYTANIVNIGISQKGIDNTNIEVIRESEFNELINLIEDKNKIIDSYQLITSENITNEEYNSYVKKYPLLETENLYILRDNKSLDNILTLPMIKRMMGFDNQEGLTEKISILEEDTKNQIAINYITKEYEIIGFKTEAKQLNYIKTAGFKMIALALLIMVFALMTTYVSAKMAANFARRLRSKVVNKVMSFSNREFEEIGSSSLITRCSNDIQQIQMLVTMFFRIIIYAPIMGIGAFIKVSNNSMSWIIALAITIIFILVILVFTMASPKFKKLQELIDRMNLVAKEILSGLPVIRAFSNEKHEEKRFAKANTDLMKINLYVNRIMTLMMPTMMFIMNGISVLILWVGADKVNMGTIQIGTLMAFITYTMQIIMSFLMISVASIMLPRAWVSVKRVGEVFNKEVTIKTIKNPLKFDKNKKGRVEFKDVYFRYPDAEEDVLQNVSFTALPGKTTAFIGSTGSGKSTLINLIPRFFDVTGGKILVEGVNIKEADLQKLRKKIGYVPQKGVLFSGTIKSNIALGTTNLANAKIKEVAKTAQALNFIEEKDKKFLSPISQAGTNVSGGQKQRLSIARAIAINPNIYIFDDSFSALDYKTDKNLRKELTKISKDKTILIVAQRINTVINAEQIIVLDKGAIVGIGTHKELIRNCEVYQEIAASQLSKEELANA